MVWFVYYRLVGSEYQQACVVGKNPYSHEKRYPIQVCFVNGIPAFEDAFVSFVIDLGRGDWGPCCA
jgi:hypothetical protein